MSIELCHIAVESIARAVEVGEGVLRFVAQVCGFHLRAGADLLEQNALYCSR